MSDDPQPQFKEGDKVEITMAVEVIKIHPDGAIHFKMPNGVQNILHPSQITKKP